MSLIEAFTTTVTVTIDGTDYQFKRYTMDMAAKLAESIKAKRTAEALKEFNESARERVALAQANGQATPAFYANESLMRQNATKGIKIGLQALFDLLDEFAGVTEILRFAAKQAGMSEETFAEVQNLIPIPMQRDLASELLIAPTGEKKSNPPAGDEKKTGNNSPLSTSPSTDTKGETFPLVSSSPASVDASPSQVESLPAA